MSSITPPNYFNILPDECFHLILSELSNKDRAHCGAVSTQFNRNVADFNDQYVLDLRGQDLSAFSVEDLEQYVADHPNIRSINLSGCIHLTDLHLSAFSQIAPQITELYLDGCSWISNEGLSYFSASPLTRLSLSGCKNIGSQGFPILTNADLEHLNLADCDITDANLRSLQGQPSYIDLSDCNQVTDAGLSCIAGPNVSVLKLKNLSLITDAGLAPFAGAKPLVLDLHECKKISSGVSNFSGPQLDYLDLEGCWAVNNNALKGFKGSKPSYVNLTNCLFVSDLGRAYVNRARSFRWVRDFLEHNEIEKPAIELNKFAKEMNSGNRSKLHYIWLAPVNLAVVTATSCLNVLIGTIQLFASAFFALVGLIDTQGREQWLESAKLLALTAFSKILSPIGLPFQIFYPGINTPNSST